MYQILYILSSIFLLLFKKKFRRPRQRRFFIIILLLIEAVLSPARTNVIPDLLLGGVNPEVALAEDICIQLQQLPS